MSDVTRRLSRWKAKFSPDIAAQTTARIFADMTARYEASMLALGSMELDTKQVLSASGIDTMYIVFYLDYARQLFRLSHGRTISGPGATGEVAGTRFETRRPCCNPLRGLQRSAARPVAAGRYPRLGRGSSWDCLQGCRQPTREGRDLACDVIQGAALHC
jgi:hypothetical protein